MTLMRYVLWFVCVLGWSALLIIIKYPLRKKRLIPLRLITVTVKAALTLFAAYEVMVDGSPIVYRLSFVLAALYVALFGDTVGDIISLPWVIRKKTKDPFKIRSVICAVCITSYLIFGTINMQTVSAHRFTITSGKLGSEYKVVFISDLHVGSSQSMDTTKKTIEKAASEDPDLVLLGGDITDEMTTREEMEEVYSILGKSGVPVYFIYGNHDRQPTHSEDSVRTYTDEQLEDAITSNGIRILKDEWISFADDLVLFGREDYSSKDRTDLSKISQRPKDAFVLLTDHSPYETEDIRESKADLQLSGHSHAGQIFPLQTLYRLAGYDANGSFHYGDTELYVSPGASGWSFPFRTEETCNYEVITLKPEL